MRLKMTMKNLKMQVQAQALPTPLQKRARQPIMSAPVAAMLNRNLLSDRAAIIIVFESIMAFG